MLPYSFGKLCIDFPVCAVAIFSQRKKKHVRSLYFDFFFPVSITFLPCNPPINAHHLFFQGDGNPVILKADAELPVLPSILKLFSPKSHLDDKKKEYCPELICSTFFFFAPLQP